MPSIRRRRTFLSLLDTLRTKDKTPDTVAVTNVSTPQLRSAMEIERLQLHREVLRNLDPTRVEQCFDTWYDAHALTEELLPRLRSNTGELETRTLTKEGLESSSEQGIDPLTKLWPVVVPPLKSAPARMTPDDWVDSTVPSPPAAEGTRRWQFSAERRTQTEAEANLQRLYHDTTLKTPAKQPPPTIKSHVDLRALTARHASLPVPPSTHDEQSAPMTRMSTPSRLVKDVPAMSWDPGDEVPPIPVERERIPMPPSTSVLPSSKRCTHPKPSRKVKSTPRLKINTSLRTHAICMTVIDSERTPSAPAVARQASQRYSKHKRISELGTVSEVTTHRESSKSSAKSLTTPTHTRHSTRSSLRKSSCPSSRSTLSCASSVKTYKRGRTTVEIEEYTLDLSTYSRSDWKYLQRQGSIPTLRSRHSGLQVKEALAENTNAEVD